MHALWKCLNNCQQKNGKYYTDTLKRSFPTFILQISSFYFVDGLEFFSLAWECT